MSITYTYNGSALTHNVKPSAINIPTHADMGEAETGGIPIEDPDQTLIVVGHKPFVVEESACSQPRIFTGWTTSRSVGRSEERGLFVGPDPALHDMSIIDLNAALSFRLMYGSDANRPEETWIERFNWIMASDYVSPYCADLGYASSNISPAAQARTMDAADYRDGVPTAVFDDLVQRLASGLLTYFLYWSPGDDAVGIFIGGPDDSFATSTISISNDPDDVNGTTVFAPFMETQLSREPDEVWSEVVISYGRSPKRLYRSRPTTASVYHQRGTVITRPYTGSATTASDQADAFLTRHSVESDRITTSILVPADTVGLIQAGQRMNVKLTHLADYAAGIDMRIVSYKPTPVDDLARFYLVDLELVNPIAATAGEPITCSLAVGTVETAEAKGPESDPNPTVTITPTRDELLIAWLIGCNTNTPWATGMTSIAGYTTIDSRDNPKGTWTIACKRGSSGVDATASASYTPGYNNAGTWLAVQLGLMTDASGPVQTKIGTNGTNRAFATFDSPPTAGNTIFMFVYAENSATTDIHVIEPGWTEIYAGHTYDLTYGMIDVKVFARCVNEGDGSYYEVYKTYGYATAIGMTLVELEISGDFDPPPDSETDLGPLPDTTVVSDTDPTGDQDADAGYTVGERWVNSATGDVFVLVDNTNGAAVWLKVPRVLDDLTDVDAPSPAEGDALTWNGTDAWEPVHALTEADVVALITPDIYYCDSIAIEAAKGTLAAGAHTDLHAVGGTTVEIDETATTPGFELRAAFSGVDGLTDIYVHGYYTASHTVTVDLYNYGTAGWDTILTFPTSGTGTTLLHGAVADGSPYFDGGGNALVRFYHAAAGNPTHRLYLDYLAISHTTGSTGGLALDDLTDVSAAAPNDGEVLTWDDGTSTWIAAAAPGTGTLDDLTDVTISTPGEGDVLTYDSGTSEWVNVAPAAGTTAPFYNVVDYGATGDGTTDDTGAIEDAIAAADATSGGTIYFPPGTYKITTTLSFTGGDYHLLGSGGRYSASVISQATANTDALSFAPSAGTAIRTKASRIENLTIAGPGGASSGAGVRTTNDVHMTHCFVYGFYYGAYLTTASYYSLIHACTFTDCDYAGVYLNFTNNTTIDSCRFTGAFPGYSAPIGALAYGVYINGGGLATRVINSSIEYFTHWGIFCTAAGSIEIIGNYFESDQGTQAGNSLCFCSGTKGLAIIANYFQGSSNIKWGVDLGSSACSGVLVSGNRIQSGTDGAIRTRNGTAGYLIGNDVTGTKTLDPNTRDLDATPPMTDPMTTRGDIIVRNAANVMARLAVGASGTVFASDGTDPSWTAPGGDVTGGVGALTVGKLQGRTVASTAPNSADVLTWDGSQWEPAAIPPGGVSEITDLPTAETDDTLVLAPDGIGGVEWRAEVGGSLALDDLTDVTVPTPSDNDVLAWDAGTSAWVNVAPGGVAEIADLPTAETTTALVLHPDGAGGVEWGTDATGAPTLNFVGYDTAGASNEAWATRKVYLKKVSLTAGQVVLSIGAYLDQTADTGNSMGVAIWTDNAGDPYDLAAYDGSGSAQNILLARASGGSRDARWLTVPINYYVPTTGDYWIGIWGVQASSRVYYDGSGSDRHFTVSFNGVSDYGRYTPTTTSNKYSIRALVMG